MFPEPYSLNSELLSWNRPIYDPVRCFGLKPELDFSHCFHKVEIQAESIRGAFDLLNRRSNGKVSQRLQNSISWLLVRWNFRKNVISEKREVLLARHRIKGLILN